MNGGYEMFVLRQLTEAAEASRRHAGLSVRTSKWRAWRNRRRAAAAARLVVSVPRQRDAERSTPELTSSSR
ncbi:hypothetical protein [Tenggerimyces flavus]|uniref:Uncharacterized protein n=1 Tax=Tenggerimyces flavus TaxID=1708749 RepID=A0ABV7YD28_9ACTN|nr:hypothetical protein [Tenggerimyces flavus]MBM7787911.1 hypothetical protein [Tenggerimyces flavus]